MIYSLKKIVDSCRRWFDFESRRKALYDYWDEQASQGDTQAAYRLTSLYPASPSNYPLAYKWTLALANQAQDCRILLQLAKMLETGAGVELDEKRALIWYERTLSLHILQGQNSPFSVSEANFVQGKIQVLRGKTGWK